MKVEREDLVKEYVELMGSDSEERGFYKDVANMTKSDLISNIIALAHYYKDYYNK